MLGAKVDKMLFTPLSPALLLHPQQCGRINTESETLEGKSEVMRSQASAGGSSWEPGRN